MSEEERRRCILLGICGGGSGLASNQDDRRSALRESLSANDNAPEYVSDAAADYILGLIDEALAMGGG